jgi:ectoine hydroxylase
MTAKLSSDQVGEFHREGYLFIPDLFSADEVMALRGELPSIFAQHRPEVWREKDNDTVRIAFAVQTYNDLFARLARHPRLIEPAKALLGEDIYIHQFKVNQKAAFNGDVWQWHQDFGTWSVDDGMPEPRALNVALFLDDVTHLNGPLMFIPRSHEGGKVEASHDTVTTSYPLWTIDDTTVRDLACEHGLVAPTGAAGSAIFFDCALLHASPGNISPWSRNIVYLTANAISNAIRRPTRPAYIASRDFTPVESLGDDCLSRETAS